MVMPNLQALRSDERDRLRFDYFEPGLDYYVAGRFTYYATFAASAAALLFHMAVERFLKGCLLAAGLGEDQRKKLEHKLNDLWTEFRKHAVDASLDAHAETVCMLDAFYVFRYPENLERTVEKEQLGSYSIMTGPLVPGNNPDFHYDIDAVDALVIALHKAGSANPKAMAMRLKPDGLEVLRRHNAYAAEWA
jgi:hypothetical protein